MCVIVMVIKHHPSHQIQDVVKVPDGTPITDAGTTFKEWLDRNAVPESDQWEYTWAVFRLIDLGTQK